MKRATLLLFLICANVHSNESCFSTNRTILELIKSSQELDECFASDKDPCNLKKKSVDFQAAINSSRLIPMNRMPGDKFMNRTTGVVSIEFATRKGEHGGERFVGSAQKISRCHVITSAICYTQMATFRWNLATILWFSEQGRLVTRGNPLRTK